MEAKTTRKHQVPAAVAEGCRAVPSGAATMGDRRVGVAVFLLCLLAVIFGLGLGADRRNASSGKSPLPSLRLDRRKRGGNTEVVFEHVGSEGLQEHDHPPVDWLVILAIIIAIILLIVLCIVVSRLPEQNIKYRRLYSVNSSSSSNPAQAFTYIDLSNGEFPCSPVPGRRPHKYPCQRTLHCEQPRFAVQYQTTNVNSNAGEIAERVYPHRASRRISDTEHDLPSVDTRNKASLHPQVAPRQTGSSGCIARSPERTLSRETVDSPTGFEPPEKRMRPAEPQVSESAFESATLKQAREIQIHTHGVGVALSTRRLLSATRASISSPPQRDTLPEPYISLLPEGASPTPPIEPEEGPPVHHLPVTDTYRPGMVRYFTYSPASPRLSSTGSLGSTALEVSESASAGESSSSPPAALETNETAWQELPLSSAQEQKQQKTEVGAQSKLPTQARPVPQFIPRLRQSAQEKRTPGLIARKPIATLTPSGTRMNVPKPFSPTRDVRPAVESAAQEKETLEPIASHRDMVHSEEVVPHPDRAEEIKRTGGTLPERLRTASAVASQQPSAETLSQFPTRAARQKLFEEAEKFPRSTPSSPLRGSKRSPPKKASVAIVEWEPPQTAGIKPKEAVSVPESVAAPDQKKPEDKHPVTDDLRSPSAPRPESLAPQSESPPSAKAAPLRTPEETALQEKSPKEKLVLPSPPIKRPSAEKPKRPSRIFKRHILMVPKRPTRKKPDDDSCTEPFSVDDTARRYSAADIISDAFTGTSIRSSICVGQTEGSPEKEQAVKTPTPPHVAPRSMSSLLSSPHTVDDSAPYYLEFELRPSIEYLPLQVTSEASSADASSGEEEAGPRMPPTLPALPASTESPSTGELCSPEDNVSDQDLGHDVFRAPSPDHSPPHKRVLAVAEQEQPFSWPKESPAETPRKRSVQKTAEGLGRQPTQRRRSIGTSSKVPTPSRHDDALTYPATGTKHPLPEPNGLPVEETSTAESGGNAFGKPEAGSSESAARTPVQERSLEERPAVLLPVAEAAGKHRESSGLTSERQASKAPQRTTDDSTPLDLLSRLGGVEREVIQPIEEPQAPRLRTWHATSPTERPGIVVVQDVIVPSRQELLHSAEPTTHQAPGMAQGKRDDAERAIKSALDPPRPPTVVPALRKSSVQWKPRYTPWDKLSAEPKVWPPNPKEGQDSRRQSVDERKLAAFPSPGPIVKRHPSERPVVLQEHQVVPAGTTAKQIVERAVQEYRVHVNEQVLKPSCTPAPPIAERPVAKSTVVASERQLEITSQSHLAEIPANQHPVPAGHKQLGARPLPPHPLEIPADQAPVPAEEGQLIAPTVHQADIEEATSGKLPLPAEGGHQAELKAHTGQIAEIMTGGSPEFNKGQLSAANGHPFKITETTSGESAVLAEVAAPPVGIAEHHGEQQLTATDGRQLMPSQRSPAEAAGPRLGVIPVVPVPELVQQFVEPLRKIITEAEYNPGIPREVDQVHQPIPIDEPKPGSTALISQTSAHMQHGVGTDHSQHSDEPHESSGTPSDSSSDRSSESERKTRRIRKIKPPKTVPTHPLYSGSMPFEQETQDIEELGPAAECLELVEETEPALQPRTSYPSLPSLHRPSIEYVPAVSLEESSSGGNVDATRPYTKGITSPVPTMASLGSPEGQPSPDRKKGQTLLMSGPDILEAPLMDSDSTPIPSFASSPYCSPGQSLERSPFPPGSPRLLARTHRGTLSKSPAHESGLGFRMTGSGFASEYSAMVPAPEAGSTELVSRPAEPRWVVSKSVEDVRQPIAHMNQTSASGTTRKQMTPGSVSGIISPDFFAAPSPVTAPGSRDLITWKTPSPSGAQGHRDVSNVSVLSDVTTAPAEASPNESTKGAAGAKTTARTMK